jgi:hypothetical protein
MARDGDSPLAETNPEPLTPELAPFVAQAQARLERATDGLDTEAAIEHLEAAVARAVAQASRLGVSLLPAPDPTPDTLALGDGSVVLVHRLGDPGQPA